MEEESKLALKLGDGENGIDVGGRCCWADDRLAEGASALIPAHYEILMPPTTTFRQMRRERDVLLRQSQCHESTWGYPVTDDRPRYVRERQFSTTLCDVLSETVAVASTDFTPLIRSSTSGVRKEAFGIATQNYGTSHCVGPVVKSTIQSVK